MKHYKLYKIIMFVHLDIRRLKKPLPKPSGSQDNKGYSYQKPKSKSNIIIFITFKVKQQKHTLQQLQRPLNH